MIDDINTQGTELQKKLFKTMVNNYKIVAEGYFDRVYDNINDVVTDKLYYISKCG